MKVFETLLKRPSPFETLLKRLLQFLQRFSQAIFCGKSKSTIISLCAHKLAHQPFVKPLPSLQLFSSTMMLRQILFTVLFAASLDLSAIFVRAKGLRSRFLHGKKDNRRPVVFQQKAHVILVGLPEGASLTPKQTLFFDQSLLAAYNRYVLDVATFWRSCLLKVPFFAVESALTFMSRLLFFRPFPHPPASTPSLICTSTKSPSSSRNKATTVAIESS